MPASERNGVLGMTEDQVNGSAGDSDQGFGSLVSPDDAAARGAGLGPTTGCPHNPKSQDVRRGTSRACHSSELGTSFRSMAETSCAWSRSFWSA
jgi:hypothetical protein